MAATEGSMTTCARGHEIRANMRGGLTPCRSCKKCCALYIALGVKVSPQIHMRREPDYRDDLKIAPWWLLAQQADAAERNRRNAPSPSARPRSKRAAA